MERGLKADQIIMLQTTPKCPQTTYADTGRTCKVHTERSCPDGGKLYLYGIKKSKIDYMLLFQCIMYSPLTPQKS